jgi:hypothetical protein
MNKTYLLVMLSLFLFLAGCTDTPDTASREYRNAINESLDAMMMVTSERSAERMNVRIFKGMNERFGAIDKKWVIIESNRTKKDFIKQVFESDGVQLYLSELQINRDRFSVETIRLKKLFDVTIEREREARRDRGEDPDAFEPREICPTLHELVMSDAALKPLEDQIMQPKLIEKIQQFPTWKVKEYSKYFEAFETRRREVFKPIIIELRN